MARFKTDIHPKTLEHGDKVTIEDGSGNQLTGLLRRQVSDNQMEISLTMTAFGKQIRVATWKADRSRWTSDFPVVNKEAALW